MIADLTKDILKDVGICAVGDIVLILKHSAKVMGIFICAFEVVCIRMFKHLSTIAFSVVISAMPVADIKSNTMVKSF